MTKFSFVVKTFVIVSLHRLYTLDTRNGLGHFYKVFSLFKQGFTETSWQEKVYCSRGQIAILQYSDFMKYFYW